MCTQLFDYDLLSPPKICFGWGRFPEVGKLARAMGKRAFVISGPRALESNGTLEALKQHLAEAGVRFVDAGGINGEPEVHHVDEIAAFLRDQFAGPGDLVISIGGGSTIDLAKAASALATNVDSDTVVDFLEGVGRGPVVDKPPLPQLAVPTTSGTGAEATKNAVISSYDPLFKKSMRSDLMVPRVVLVDPELTVSVPPTTTAHTGMDAITQLIESYISERAKPIPQLLALEGLKVAVAGETPAIVRAFRDGSDREAREAMAQAALFSGIALANSGLGFAHGVAPALGVHCRVPHGLACAVMLPHAIRVNREVRGAELATLAEVMTGRSFGDESEAVEAAVEKIESMCDAVEIPRRLSDIGVQPDQVPEIVPSCRGNSMSANPCEVSDDELTSILDGMF